MSVAIVPVGRLEEGKSRLLSELDAEARAELCLAMLDDVIAALQACPSVETVAVATPDPRIATHARARGAEVVVREEPGLNAAIDDAATRLVGEEDAPVLVVLGDVAGARADDLEALFTELRRSEGRMAAVLAPSGDGGTSALLRTPWTAIPSCFGASSAKRHRDAADEAGVPLTELHLDSLALDLDRAEDLVAFMRAKPTPGDPAGRRTRALLARLGFGRRVAGDEDPGRKKDAGA